MSWNVEVTDEARDWLQSLTDDDFVAMSGAIDLLADGGPALGRPVVDTITGSRIRNMKELRSVSGHLRALFCFDPRRTAIILIGGDKRNDWHGWYETNIPVAEALYDIYLRELREEGLI